LQSCVIKPVCLLSLSTQVFSFIKSWSWFRELISAFLHVHLQTMVYGIYPFLHLVPFIGPSFGASPHRSCKGKFTSCYLFVSDRFQREERFLTKCFLKLWGRFLPCIECHRHNPSRPQPSEEAILASCKWTPIPIPIPFPSLFFSCLFLLRSPFVFFLHGSRRSLSMIYLLQPFQDHRPAS